MAIARGIHRRNLILEQFNSICGELLTWRIDRQIREMRETGSSGMINPFVRGLRFSAHITYAIRENLEHGLHADWGQILDAEGNYCSPECDIIIYRGRPCKHWNGNRHPVMDFVFVAPQDAVVIISCKSYLKHIDKAYCTTIKPFVNRVWLFAECCDLRSLTPLQQAASRAGYEKLWHLYSLPSKKDPVPNNEGWLKFINEINTLR